MRHDQLLPAIRQILFEEWDPIGINDQELCRDEYDSYAPEIMRLLLSGADEFKIASRLTEFQHVNMGMSRVDHALHQRVARRLLDLI